MASKIWRNLIRTAAAACFVVGSSAQAGGVFYQSDFDPLGFAGSATWRVDDNCNIGSLANGYYGVNLLAPGGCNVSLWTLDVQLWEGNYATVGLAQSANDPTLVSVPFDNEQGNLDPSLVAGIWVQGGALAGVDTFLIGPEWISNSPNGTINNNYGVQFSSGHSPFGVLAPWFGGSIPAIGNLPGAGAYLWEEGYNWLTIGLAWAELCPEFLWATFACAKEVPVNSGGYAPFTGPQAFFRIPDPDVRIPEPGSLALLGGALVAGWLTRRRKPAA